MSVRLQRIAFVLLAFVVACHGGDDKKDAGPECTTNAQCTGGNACISGQCAPCQRDNQCNRDQFCTPHGQCEFSPCFGDGCMQNSDCDAGQFCVQGLCLTGTQPGAIGVPVGGGCNTSGDCVSNYCDLGVCCGVILCVPGASQAQDGGTGDGGGEDGGLEDAGSDAGLTDAGSDAGPMDAGVEDAGVEDAGLEDAGADGGVFIINSCASDQICDPTNDVCVANLGCTSNADCGAGLACNVGSGACVTACTAENTSTVCGITQVCNNGLCVDCTNNTDCGPGLTCNTTTFTCIPPEGCTSDRDCNVPMVCNLLTNTCTTTPPECLSDMDCPMNYMCQTQTGECVSGVCTPDTFFTQYHNDTFANAAPITVGDTSNLAICSTSSTQMPAEYFSINLNSGDVIDVYANTQNTLLGHFIVSIYSVNSPGTPLVSGQYSAVYTAGIAGTYVIECTDTASVWPYELQITVTAGTPCSTVDTNNLSFTTAQPVQRQGWVYGQTVCPGVGNFFVVDTGGHAVTAVLDSTPTLGVLDMTMYDASQNVLAQGSEVDGGPCGGDGGSGNDTCITLESPATVSQNRVYIEVYGDDETVTNAYDLELLFQ